jgi:hypothetical protein
MKQNKILLWVLGITAVVGGALIAVKAFNRSQENKKQDAIADQPEQADQQTPAPVEKNDGYTKLLDSMTQGIAKGVKSITRR